MENKKLKGVTWCRLSYDIKSNKEVIEQLNWCEIKNGSIKYKQYDLLGNEYIMEYPMEKVGELCQSIMSNKLFSLFPQGMTEKVMWKLYLWKKDNKKKG